MKKEKISTKELPLVVRKMVVSTLSIKRGAVIKIGESSIHQTDKFRLAPPFKPISLLL